MEPRPVIGLGFFIEWPGLGISTYPIGAAWDVHASPDHSNGMLDGLDRGVRAGIRAVHPALHLDVNGLAFPILQKSRG